MKKILEKISLIQQSIEKINKNAENPFYKSNYADLGNIQDHLQAYLESNRLVIYHQVIDNKVRTTIFCLDSEETLSSEIEISMQDPQKKGSEITYYRRYNLVALFDLKIVDDDANSTTTNPNPKPQEKGKIDVWLGDKVFEKVKSLNAEQIRSCLDKYNGKPFEDGKTYGMKKEYRSELEKLVK